FRLLLIFFFFFQAEDGIRDFHVTGVQTCALPISTIHFMAYRRSPLMQERLADNRQRITRAARRLVAGGGFRAASMTAVAREAGQIGRASCRERASIAVVAAA